MRAAADSVMRFTDRGSLERLCDASGRLGVIQLPLFRAAADGLLCVFRIEHPETAWPGKTIERSPQKPVCFMIGADPGLEYPDPPPPPEWACARRLKYWCAQGAAVVHGAGGTLDDYRQAAHLTMMMGRVAFIETTSARADEWASFLSARKMIIIRPSAGQHPIAAPREPVQ
jgi:hypothetical protein